jgi:sulfite exporter TauE/SafE
LVPFLIAEHRDTKGNFFIVMEYLSGRLIAYIIAGIIAGITGILIGNMKISGKIYGILIIITAFLMLLYSSGVIFEGIEKANKYMNFFKVSARIPFTAGLINGLNFCPPFMAAFSYTIALKTIFGSILYFLFFFAATSVYVVPFIFTGLITRFDRVRNAGRIAAILVSIWLLIYGIYLITK